MPEDSSTDHGYRVRYSIEVRTLLCEPEYPYSLVKDLSLAEQATSNALAAVRSMGIIYGLFGRLSLVDAERARTLRGDLGQVLETVAALGLELVDDAVHRTDSLHELYKDKVTAGGRGWNGTFHPGVFMSWAGPCARSPP
ncbi:MAG: hypothetical protein M3416_03845 [Acidobacteriota bacterium]|nr:hypothetical protein [Acidobacteriota bacterium]